MFTNSLQNERPLFYPPLPPVEPKTGSWYERNQETLYDVFSIVIFPIGIVRCANYLLGRCILPIAILPSTIITSLSAVFGPTDRMQKLNNFFQGTLQGNAISYLTKDGVAIDAFVVQNSCQNQLPPSEQRWVVVPMPNAAWYQDSLNSLCFKAANLGVNVLAMNYRGTDRFWSPWPSCKEDIIEDVDAGVRWLLSLKIQPKHILMDGLSMGGATAIQVAAKHQYLGTAMPVLAQNTFSTLEEVAFVKTSTTIKWFVSFLLRNTGWDFDNVSAYRKLRGPRLFTYSPNDHVIPASASLAGALQKENERNVIKLGKNSGHCTTLLDDSRSDYIFFAKSALGLPLHVHDCRNLQYFAPPISQ